MRPDLGGVPADFSAVAFRCATRKRLRIRDRPFLGYGGFGDPRARRSLLPPGMGGLFQ